MTTQTATRTAIQTKASTLLAALDTCLATVANASDQRPVLQAVKVTATGDKATFASSNGFHMAIVDVEFDGIGEIDTLIHADAVQKIVKLLKSVGKRESESVTVELTDSECTIPNVGTIPVQVQGGTFPDYEKLVPDNESQVSRTDKVAYNADLLIKAATVAKKYTGSSVMRVFTPATETSPTLMTWQVDEGVNVRYVVMPMFVKWS